MLKQLTDMVSKRADPNYHQISGHIPKEMATEFKIACTRRGVSHSEGLEQAVTLWLAQNTQQSAKNRKND
ncbi:MAG: hypothetical protein F6K31_29425 [Symploca sp. SIO2G7]|nr:hypothetical protein [Symploca sp. SIO2G7]